MARIRNVKPEFFTSEAVSTLPLRARLTWIGLWTHCDNHGRARDNVKLIKAAVWPLDTVSLREIEEDLATLAVQGRIVRYEVDGKRYLEITNWGEHQYGAFKGPAKHPGPNDGAFRLNSDGSRPGVDESGQSTTTNPVDNSGESAEMPVSPAVPHSSKPSLDTAKSDIDKSSGIQVSGVRGQGRGTREDAHPSTSTPEAPQQTRPDERCPRHRDHPDPPPCGQCADTRRAAEAWDERDKATRVRAESDAARQRAADRARAIDNCSLCDGDGYAGSRVCDHDPDATERAQRGIARARAALTRKDTPA